MRSINSYQFNLRLVGIWMAIVGTLVPFHGSTAAGVNITSARVEGGLQVLYGFDEGSGLTVHDASGIGEALDLQLENTTGVTWLPGEGLRLDSPAVLTSISPALKLFNAFKATEALTIEAWVTPANTTQGGPARIAAFTLNGYPDGGNFVIGQNADLIEVRLRSTDTDQYGRPSLLSAVGSLPADLTEVGKRDFPPMRTMR